MSKIVLGCPQFTAFGITWAYANGLFAASHYKCIAYILQTAFKVTEYVFLDQKKILLLITLVILLLPTTAGINSGDKTLIISRKKVKRGLNANIFLEYLVQWC